MKAKLQAVKLSAQPVPYTAPTLTRQGQWQTITLVLSAGIGPGNFGLPSMDGPPQN